MRSRWRQAAVAVAALVLLTSGCGVRQFNFVEDTRVHFLAPKSRSTVTFPLAVRWEIRDFAVTGPDGRAKPDSGYFAVFVDQAPVPPGKPLSWVARSDRACRASKDCPDAAYYTSHNVYPTSETKLTLSVLPDVDNPAGQREQHEITLVLLDGTGRRIGESAWYVDVFYHRLSE